MKTLSIALIAVLLASCSKENLRPYGEYSLYNDPQQRVKMVISDNSVSFSRNDSLLSVVEYSGDLLAQSFTMPANVWENHVPVVGTWQIKYAFLEFSYVAANRDSISAQYIPFQTYQLDFYKP